MARRTTEYHECEPIVRGAVHELEHTDDWETAMDIAADHLREREDYYAVLEAAMGEDVRPNVAAAAAGAVATMLLPYALDLAMKYPREAGQVLSYAAMVAFPPYGLARAGWAVGRWARGRAKKALGFEKNAAVTASLAALTPATRRVVQNLLKWLAEAYQLGRAGLAKADIVKWLRDNGIAARLANAITDAVISVIAQEAAEGVRSGGQALKSRALGAPPPAVTPNGADRYYVWTAALRDLAIVEGPFGPYPLTNAKTYARIAATKGRQHRIVTHGKDPQAATFEVVRIYEAGTGNHL